MHTRHRLLLAALLLAVCPAFGAAPAKPLHVTFWNIEWFPGARPNASLEEQKKQTDIVQREIVKLAPDILGMAELRDAEAAQLAIAKLPGFKVDVCSNFAIEPKHPGTQQVAIASRLPALAAWAEPFTPNSEVLPPRGFAFAAYQLAPDRVLFVYAVHFKSNRGDLPRNIALREESMRQMLAHHAAMKLAYSRMGSITTVFGGDFNTSLDDARFKDEKTLRSLEPAGFLWAFKGISPAGRVTLPGSRGFPDATFDHIFAHNARIVRASVKKTPPEASDHRPVSAIIEPAAVAKK